MEVHDFINEFEDKFDSFTTNDKELILKNILEKYKDWVYYFDENFLEDYIADIYPEE